MKILIFMLIASFASVTFADEMKFECISQSGNHKQLIYAHNWVQNHIQFGDETFEIDPLPYIATSAEIQSEALACKTTFEGFCHDDETVKLDLGLEPSIAFYTFLSATIHDSIPIVGGGYISRHFRFLYVESKLLNYDPLYIDGRVRKGTVIYREYYTGDGGGYSYPANPTVEYNCKANY